MKSEDCPYIVTAYALSLKGDDVSTFAEEYENAENKIEFCIKKWEEIRKCL